MIAESLNIPKTAVLRILKEDFCSRDFSCCKIMRPPTKLQVFAQFFTPKKCYNPLSSPVLSRFISARISCFHQV
jgi:hypothetical protein